MTDEFDALEAENWLHFKFFREQRSDDAWRTQLDWYHDVLRSVVKPWVSTNRNIRFVFFGIYGPEPYSVEPQNYVKRISSRPSGKVNYVRLRAFVPQDRQAVNDALIETVQNHRTAIWDYEILEGYNVLDDLGNRFGRLDSGSIDNNRTTLFIRYWDAACRYILEILTRPGNWDSNVDVWGIPHLVNNSLGAWLRVSSVKCPSCSTAMYMATWWPIPQQLLSQLGISSNAPICLFMCPQCPSVALAPINI